MQCSINIPHSANKNVFVGAFKTERKRNRKGKKCGIKKISMKE
jgi:hypothetical protein